MDAIDPPRLLIIGVLLLVGWTVHALGKVIHVPRATLLLIVGMVAGPAVLGIVPAAVSAWFPEVANFALAMVGFLLGENLAGRHLRASARTVLYVSIGASLMPALAVAAAVGALSGNLALALLLGGIATATAPAVTFDIVRQDGRRGPLSRIVLGVVAIDDAWGVLLFSLMLVLAQALAGRGDMAGVLLAGGWKIGGALMLGVLIGIPMGRVTGRVHPGEPTLVEAAGFVFLCAGVAQLIGASYLLASMALGATVALSARHHTRPFRQIEGASEPFLVMFFLLAGHAFEPAALLGLGAVGVAYLVARTLGKIVGARLAARLAGAPRAIEQRVGWCLLPQAGVALGLALLANEQFPELGSVILPLTIATSVVFELVGSIITGWQLRHAGEF
ncbi:MAG: cation:proton antiporter [Burkholderiales bacterium]|nr:cation:proton antiporter [Burkholderiales bacterium]